MRRILISTSRLLSLRLLWAALAAVPMIASAGISAAQEEELDVIIAPLEEPPARGSVRIALLPVVVHSAEDPRYLRDGLADMLAARLDQASVFSVTRIEDPEAATSRLAEALSQARGQNVDFVLFGSFTRFGQGASLDIQCAAVSDDDEREPLREIFVHSGSIGDVIPDLDELVGKIARFTVTDYAARSAVSAGPPAALGGAGGQMDDLRRRLDRLERRLDDLARGPGPEAP